MKAQLSESGLYHYAGCDREIMGIARAASRDRPRSASSSRCRIRAVVMVGGDGFQLDDQVVFLNQLQKFVFQPLGEVVNVKEGCVEIWMRAEELIIRTGT